MTRSKLELATILSRLRGDDSDPEKLAREMTLIKLCYEIQKIEETQPPPEIQKIEEAQPPPEPKKRKHALSWLLDSSDDE